MSEFVEKLIGRLKELKRDSINGECPIVLNSGYCPIVLNSEDCETEYSCASCYLNAVIIFVNELAKEYDSETNA